MAEPGRRRGPQLSLLECSIRGLVTVTDTQRSAMLNSTLVHTLLHKASDCAWVHCSNKAQSVWGAAGCIYSSLLCICLSGLECVCQVICCLDSRVSQGKERNLEFNLGCTKCKGPVCVVGNLVFKEANLTVSFVFRSLSGDLSLILRSWKMAAQLKN